MNHPPPPGTRTFLAPCETCGGVRPHYTFTDDVGDEFGREPGAVNVLRVCTECGRTVAAPPG
jgi:hypothetical protein